jgi:hypothetical protein
MIRVIEGNILEQIRQAPLMYLGERSLSYMYHFITGYSMHRSQPPNLLPADFHEWVAYRLHHLEPTSGYRNMILNRCPNEEEAFSRFFELLDDHHSRSPKNVGKIRAHPIDPDIFKMVPETEEKTRVRVDGEVNLVTYTDDPGFFVVHEDPNAEYPSRLKFLPSLSWLEVPYKPDPEYLTVVNRPEFSRLMRESEMFEQNRKKQREADAGECSK